MVIYSTTRDKPVLGEIAKMGLCQMLTKGHCMYRGGLKNSSSCVSVEYTSQATSTNPHFFRLRPPLDIFWRAVYNYFCCYFILVFGRSYDVKNLLKFIIMLLRRIEKTLRKISQWKSWKIALDESGRLHSLSHSTKERRATF